MIKPSFRILFLSILGHLVLLVLASIVLTKQQHDFGKSDTTVVESYLQKVEPLPMSVASAPLKPATLHQKISQHSIKPSQHQTVDASTRKAHMAFSAKNDQTDNHQNNLHLKAGGGNMPIPALLALLHEAIQKQQQYPLSALQMEREGHTTVGFLLFPNGTITKLHIIKTSGTAVLDDAAVTAINKAVPFLGVNKFLHGPQEYQVTVAFELTA